MCIQATNTEPSCSINCTSPARQGLKIPLCSQRYPGLITVCVLSRDRIQQYQFFPQTPFLSYCSVLNEVSNSCSFLQSFCSSEPACLLFVFCHSLSCLGQAGLHFRVSAQNCVCFCSKVHVSIKAELSGKHQSEQWSAIQLICTWVASLTFPECPRFTVCAHTTGVSQTEGLKLSRKIKLTAYVQWHWPALVEDSHVWDFLISESLEK